MYNKVVKKIRFSKIGFEELKKKLEDLKNQRPSAVLDLKKARDMGDLSENGYYKAAKGKLSEIDRLLRNYAYEIKNAYVVLNIGNDKVGIGTKVELSNGTTFEIVGDMEANPTDGKISLLSPLGRALENREVGDVIELITPKGKVSYKITKIT